MKIPSHLLFLCSTFVSAAALSAAAPDFTALEKRLERGALCADAALVAEATSAIDAELAIAADSPAWRYLRGYAAYAAAIIARASNDNAAAIARFDEGIALLAQVQGDKLWIAEATALASAMCSGLIGLQGGASGMTLGPKAGELMAIANRNAPRSPRVLYFTGVARLFTPPEFGGDRAQGLQLLQEAVAAFAQQKAGDAGLHWGHAEALTWLGVAKQQSGDLAGAREAWTQALALEPGFVWVKHGLLPSLPAQASSSTQP